MGTWFYRDSWGLSANHDSWVLGSIRDSWGLSANHDSWVLGSIVIPGDSVLITIHGYLVLS